ncbi:MAG: alpha/beta hydrolase [Clostridiales bacterium]|nr:alpha/beta hydrolase [Clostridiales bacterium]
MRDEIDGVRFEYEVNGHYLRGAKTVVFLHGWGGDLRSFRGAFSAVTDLGLSAVNFAFPKEVPPDWGVYDYAAFVGAFLEREGIAGATIVGHSFGGRVGIILAAQRKAEKLVLVDAAGMKPRFSLRKKIKIARYKRAVKCGKPLDGMGSVDYNNTSGDGRKVFVRIVNTHLDKLLPYIECETLIVCGKSDKDTPPYMAKRLKRGIKNSELVFLDGGHYCYTESHHTFVRLLKKFLSAR